MAWNSQRSHCGPGRATNSSARTAATAAISWCSIRVTPSASGVCGACGWTLGSSDPSRSWTSSAPPDAHGSTDRLVGGAVVDGQLVEAELWVVGEGGVGRCVLPGLEVDDDHVAVLVELEPVDVADQAHLLSVGKADGRGDPALGRDGGARARPRLPRDEAAQGVAHRLALAFAGPGRPERHPVPDPVDHAHQVVLGCDLAPGHPVGDGMDDDPEALGGRADHGAAGLLLQEPLGGAGQQALERARGHPDRLVGVAHRRGRAARRTEPPPRGGVCGRRQRPPVHLGRGECGQRRWAAARRSSSGSLGSAAVRRSSATTPASDSGRRGRPCRCSGSPAPSSSRNRDGCSPSSSGEATAVTTRRRRARVAAT